ncbi:hypothetical protein BDP67DRAFT_549741 [Colletotrichum lupini]|nr:hypothetical protein BDP67DRAFT_549741 [Colletotrichum lupini]
MASSLVLSHLSSAQDGKSCQPYTWDSLSQMRIAAADDDSGPTEGTLIIVNPGEVNCRYWTDTPKDVSYYTCSELAQRYDMPSDLFFTLNPSLDRDCGNIKPQTEYCVSGFIEPIRAQCCNSETWTCGDSTEDCAPGTCYEGDCVGDTVYSTDGTCGQDYGFRVCAGRWGSCCSLDGRCGTGDAFCGLFACPDGDCDIWKQDEQPAGTKWTKDGTCGGAEGMRCSAEWGRCCNVNGRVWNLCLDFDISRVHTHIRFVHACGHFDVHGPRNLDSGDHRDLCDNHRHLHSGSLSCLYRRLERDRYHRKPQGPVFIQL